MKARFLVHHEKSRVPLDLGSLENTMCYTDRMTSREVKSVLDRVLTWPKERQENAVEILEHMEKQDKSPLRLTEEQAAEVRRRLKEKSPKTITLAEFNKHIRSR